MDALQRAIAGQYHAGLTMLREPIERCSDGLWTARSHAADFWQVAYHALFFTHLYLQPDEASFEPWEHHRQEYQFIQSVPWPPFGPPNLGEPYTREQVLAYGSLCDGMIDDGVARLDLGAGECGFWWYKMPKLDHQIMNLRHLQHHAADLAERVRAEDGGEFAWYGGRGGFSA
jgi:hypothetical protein